MVGLDLDAPASEATAATGGPRSRELSPRGRKLTPAALARHVGSAPLPARTMAFVTGSTEGLDPLEAAVVRWVNARLVSLARRILSGDERSFEYRYDVAALAGFGLGAVATGDEVLVGALAMARRLEAAGRATPKSVAALAAALARPPADVPAASRRKLTEAAQGRFPLPLAGLVEVIGDPETDRGAFRERASRLAGGGEAFADLLAGAVAVARAALERGEVP